METQSTIQFVMGVDGKPVAVMVDIATWEQALMALEEAQDVTAARDFLARVRLSRGYPKKGGYTAWEQAWAELSEMDDAEK
jgi:hypothetical protein